MVWMLYLSIDHRHGGSEAKLDHHLAVVSCYSRDKKQKDGVEVRKNQEKEGESWKKMTTKSAFWAGRLIKQEKPRNSTKGWIDRIQGQVPINEEHHKG